MTFTFLGDEFIDDPTLNAVSRDARLLHVEGLVWCNKHTTDGAIPTTSLRFTDSPDAAAAVAELVENGLWEETDDGWQIVAFAKGAGGVQESAESVSNRRQLKAFKNRRAYMHKVLDDHSWCTKGKYCPRGELRPDARPDLESQTGLNDGLKPGINDPSSSSSFQSEGQEKGQGDSAPTAEGGQDFASEDQLPPTFEPFSVTVTV